MQSEPSTYSCTPSAPKLLKRLLVGLLVASLALVLFSQRPTLVIKTLEVEQPGFTAITDDGYVLSLRRTSIPSDHALTIRNTSSGVHRLVCFGEVRNAMGSVVPPERFVARNGSWGPFNGIGGRTCSVEAGGETKLEIFSTSLRIVFLQVPIAGSMTVEWNGETRSFDLSKEGESWLTLDLPSRENHFLTTLPFTTSSIRLRGNTDGVSGWEVRFLGRTIASGAAVPDSPITIPVEWKMLATIIPAVSHCLVFLGLSVAMAAIFFVGGLPLCAGFLRQLSRLERVLVPTLVGFGFALLATSSLALFGFPFRTGAPAAIALSLTGWIGILARTGITELLARFRSEPAAASAFTGTAAWVSVLSSIVFLSPEWAHPGWYLGESFTDTFWYLNGSEILLSTPTTQFYPEIWAFQRLADLAGVGLVSVLTPFGTKESYALLAFFLWTLLPFVGAALATRLNLSGRGALFSIVALGSSANFYGIFAESYFAHFVFCHVFLHSLTLTLIYLQEMPRAENWGRTWLIGATAVEYALALAVYPYHFIVPLALAAASLAWWAQGERRAVPWLAALGCTTALLANKHLSLVFSFGSNLNMVENLNQIARHIVFPFYRDPLEAKISLGLADFMQHSRESAPILSELLYMDFPNPVRAISVAGNALLAVSALVFAAGCIGGLRRLDPARTCVTLCSVGMMALAGYFLRQDQAYAFGKQMLTLGVISLPVIAIGVEAFGGLVAGSVAGLFTVGFVGLNLASAYLTVAPQFLDRDSTLLHRLRSHNPILIEDWRRLEEEFDEHPGKPGQRILISGYPEELRATDKDRILFWLLWNIQDGYRLVSNSEIPMGTQGGARTERLEPSRFNRLYGDPRTRYLLVFRGSPPQMVPKDFKQVLAGRYFTVFRRS